MDSISSLLRSNEAWALAISFDGAKVEGQSFLDVRVRICVRGEVENVHLVAIPLRASHAGLKMAQIVEKAMLEVGGECWRENLVGIATEGARNMTERHSGAVTRLVEGTLPGFYRIWCAAHQLDLVIQSVIASLCEDTFYETVTGLISHLRRQQKLVAEMKSTCPTVASTRWLSLGHVEKWLSKHREAVIRHLDEKMTA
jgi:hypothetical protein